MTDAILNYLKERDGLVTFAELSRNIPGFKGKGTYMHEVRNIVLWTDISPEAIEALQALIEEKLIIPNGTSVITYLNDSALLDLPIALQITTPYNRPHWWPLTFSLPRHFEKVAGADAAYFNDEK